MFLCEGSIVIFSYEFTDDHISCRDICTGIFTHPFTELCVDIFLRKTWSLLIDIDDMELCFCADHLSAEQRIKLREIVICSVREKIPSETMHRASHLLIVSHELVVLEQASRQCRTL